jgi:hypothetical protein
VNNNHSKKRQLVNEGNGKRVSFTEKVLLLLFQVKQFYYGFFLYIFMCIYLTFYHIYIKMLHINYIYLFFSF